MTVGIEELVGVSVARLDADLRHIVGIEEYLVDKRWRHSHPDDVLHLRHEPRDVLGTETRRPSRIECILHGLVEVLHLVGRQIGQYASQVASLRQHLLQSVGQKLQVGVDGIYAGLRSEVPLARLQHHLTVIVDKVVGCLPPGNQVVARSKDDVAALLDDGACTTQHHLDFIEVVVVQIVSHYLCRCIRG